MAWADACPFTRAMDDAMRLPGRFRAAVLGLALGSALLAAAARPVAASTLDAVKARGVLVCGINPNLPGFGMPDGQGGFKGLNADLCRAVAAAVLGDGTRVRFMALTAPTRFTALQSGAVDVLMHNSTWTLSRDTGLGISLTGIDFYDGQAFMVHRGSRISALADLAGASVCIQQGSTAELNASDYFRARGMAFEPVAFADDDGAAQAFQSGRCDALTSDASALAATRLKLAHPEDAETLPEIISKEPIGPAVRKGDDGWFDIVRWTLFALIDAEDLGVTRANARDLAAGKAPELRRLLGTEGGLGKGLGLADDWALSAIAAVGNYGEIFDRNLGAGSALKLPRGPNASWLKGGLMYAPPVR